MLDSFGQDPVLFITESGPASAAAVLLSSTQEAELIQNLQQLDFSVIPGTLQMLQAIPQSSMATVTATMERLYLAGQSAVKVAGYNSYYKLMLLGTRPGAQGMGLGGALIAAVKAAADEQQLPLYLEVANSDLVAVFQRHGFAVVGNSECRTLMLRLGQANKG